MHGNSHILLNSVQLRPDFKKFQRKMAKFRFKIFSYIIINTVIWFIFVLKIISVFLILVEI